MSNLWPLIMLPFLVACGDKEEDTAQEDTAISSSQSESQDTSEE